MSPTHHPLDDLERQRRQEHRAQTSKAFDLRRSLTEEGTEIRASGELLGTLNGRLLELAVTGMIASGGTVFDENGVKYIESADEL